MMKEDLEKTNSPCLWAPMLFGDYQSLRATPLKPWLVARETLLARGLCPLLTRFKRDICQTSQSNLFRGWGCGKNLMHQRHRGGDVGRSGLGTSEILVIASEPG